MSIFPCIVKHFRGHGVSSFFDEKVCCDVLSSWTGLCVTVSPSEGGGGVCVFAHSTPLRSAHMVDRSICRASCSEKLCPPRGFRARVCVALQNSLTVNNVAADDGDVSSPGGHLKRTPTGTARWTDAKSHNFIGGHLNLKSPFSLGSRKENIWFVDILSDKSNRNVTAFLEW